MAASAAVDRFERENGIVGLDEVTDETRQQGFGTSPEPYDSRVDDRARSEKAESRKVRPGLCPTRILQGGHFNDKQWLQDGTDAEWENFNPKQVQVMMVTLTALPMYTGDVRGIRGTYGRKLNLQIGPGQRAGPILKVAQIRGDEQLTGRIINPRDLHRVGFVEACIRNPFYDSRACPDDEEYVWVNAWCSHNDKGVPRGIRYVQEVFTSVPLTERDRKAISGLGQEIGPEGTVRTVVRQMLFVGGRPRGERHNAAEVTPPPPQVSDATPYEQIRGCSKPTESTRGVCSWENYKPHVLGGVPSKAPAMAKQARGRTVGAGSPAVAKTQGSLGRTVSPPKQRFPDEEDVYARAKSAPKEWKEAMARTAAPPAEPKAIHHQRGAWAGGGPDRYVNIVTLPDPLNKNTEVWWKEIEESPSGIQKLIDECLLWWPTAHKSKEVTELSEAIEILKDFHNRDYYRGTDQEKVDFEEAVDVYFSMRKKFQEASQREREWTSASPAAVAKEPPPARLVQATAGPPAKAKEKPPVKLPPPYSPLLPTSKGSPKPPPPPLRACPKYIASRTPEPKAAPKPKLPPPGPKNASGVPEPPPKARPVDFKPRTITEVMKEGPPIRKQKGMEIPETTVWNPGELSEIHEETPSGERKSGSAGPLPHWMGVKEPAFHGGSKTPGPLPSTVPMPKRTLSVLRPPPPPPTHTDPIIEKRNEDKREGPTGPPGPLLPVDKWTVDKTRVSLNEHVEEQARSRSRNRIASQHETSAHTLPEVRLQGFGTCPEPYDSRVGHDGADDAMSNSASSENSAVDMFLRNVAAGDEARERARLEDALRPVALTPSPVHSESEANPEDEVVTVLDPDDEPDPSEVSSDITMEDAPGLEEKVKVPKNLEVSETVRRHRETQDRTIDTYAARLPEMANGWTVPPVDVQTAAIINHFREGIDDVKVIGRENVVSNVINRHAEKLRAKSLETERNSRKSRAASAEPVPALPACDISVMASAGVKARARQINQRIEELDSQFKVEVRLATQGWTAMERSQFESITEIVCRDCENNITKEECLSRGMHASQFAENNQIRCQACIERVIREIADRVEECQVCIPDLEEAPTGGSSLEGDDPEWINIDVDEGEYEINVGAKPGIFVTPEMDPTETMRLMNAQPASFDVTSKAAMIRSALQVMHPEIAQELMNLSFSDKEIFEESQRAGIELADGDTDTESVCDFDSGNSAGLVRKKGRDRYWYVREPKEAPYEASSFRRECVPCLYKTEGVDLVHFCWAPKYDEAWDQPTVLEKVAKFTAEGAEIRHDWLPMGQRTAETDESTLSIREGKSLKMIKNDLRRPEEIQSMEIDDNSMKAFWEGFLLQLNDKDISVSAVTDDFVDRVAMGYDSNFVGHTRQVTICGACHGPLLRPKTKIRVCGICNQWIHYCDKESTGDDDDVSKDCFATHVGSHHMGVLQRGNYRKERQRDSEAKFAEERKQTMKRKEEKVRREKEARRRDLESANASDGSFIEVTSGSEKGSSGHKEAAKDDAMAAFHEARPKVIYDTELARVNRSDEGLKSLRTDTSCEEDLDGTPYCTQCGSETCVRRGTVCQERHIGQKTEWILDFFFQDEHLGNITKYAPEFRLADLEKIRTELEGRLERIAGRNKSKERTYAERRSRNNEVNMEALMSADPSANYEYVRREVAAATANKGQRITTGSKWICKRAGEGGFYNLGSAAEGVIDCGMLCTVYRAIELYKHREKDGVAQPAMLTAAANKAKEYLRHASGRQLGADWATDCCQIILTAFQESQEVKGYRPYDPQSDYNPQEECCLEPEEVVGDVPDDSRPADEGAETSAKLWSENEVTLAAVVKQKLDGKYVLTLWHLQKARSLEFHQMRMAQRDAKKRFVVPQDGKETLSQKILKGKSGAVSACSMSVEERDMSEGSTEEDKWRKSRDELRNMSASERASYDVFEAKRRMEREARDEEELYNNLGAYSWECARCGNSNSALHATCTGSLRAKDGSYKVGACGASQAENFAGFAPRATVVAGQPTVWTRYEITERHSKSGTRMARERYKAYRDHKREREDAGSTAEDETEIQAKGLKAHENIRRLKTNQRRNRKDKIIAAVLEDETKWPCLGCKGRTSQNSRDMRNVHDTGDPLSDDPLLESVTSAWNAGSHSRCYQCSRYRSDMQREHGKSYWVCLCCDNPLCALSLKTDRECPNCKQGRRSYPLFACTTLKEERTGQFGRGDTYEVKQMPEPSVDAVDTWTTWSSASSVASSSANESDVLSKRHKKRGGGGKAKPLVQKHWNAEKGHGKGFVCPYDHARPRDTRSEDEGSPRRRPRQTSGARTTFMGLAAVATLGTAEGVEMATATTGGGCVFAAAILLGAISTVKRSTDAVGGIIEVTAEASTGIINVTREAAEAVIEEIGKEGKRLVPIAFGIAVVVILVSLNVFVTYFWRKKPKVEMLKAGRNPSSNDMSLVAASLAPDRVDKIYGMPLLRCSTRNTLREHVANYDDAMRMCQQEIANHGHWVRPCDTFHSKVFFVYEVYSQNMKSHDPNHKQFWLVRLHKASCESSDPNVNWRVVINCNCGGYHQLGLQDTKRLCKHCGLVILLCRLAWHQQLVSCDDANRLGPKDRAASLRTSAKQQASLMKAEARTIAERITELESQTSVLSQSSIPAQIQRLEDTFVEIQQNVRSARMNEPLVVTLAPGNELRPLEKDGASPDAQQQGFGTSLEPYDSRAERPKSVRSRGSNKILERLDMPRDDVVDEAALRAMFEGYDKTADNAADINLEGSGRVICEMSSKQTLKFAIRMIDKATHEVVLTAYTFDVAALVETLSNAASRGAQVKVYVDRDHALRGTTLNMPSSIV